MFKEIKENILLNNDYGCLANYTIIDSNFEIIIQNKGLPKAHWVTMIIDEYENRQLNVAANLVRFFEFMHNQGPWSSIKERMDYANKNIVSLEKYKKDIDKYLLLM